jgi:hypothetical protein
LSALPLRWQRAIARRVDRRRRPMGCASLR